MSTRDLDELQQVRSHQHLKHHQYQPQHQDQLLQDQQNHRLNYQNNHNQLHHHNQQQQHQQTTNNGNHSNGRRQVGLTPSQGHDAPYKRSSSRASKRSRSERTSYLMATGHLDIEETKQLTSGASDSNRQPSDKSLKRSNVDSSHTSLLVTTSPLSIRPTGDQALLTGSGSNSFTALPTMNPFDTHDSIFAHNNFKQSKSTRQANKKDRGQFRQTYTEVAMPMKTSPAFEYILKDDRRRHRRCYLWLVYSLLITICFAIIIFSSAQVVLRYHRGQQ